VDILKYSDERYTDTITGRKVVVGRYQDSLVLIPYEIENDSLVLVTIHTTTRQQLKLKYRIRVGRFYYE